MLIVKLHDSNLHNHNPAKVDKNCCTKEEDEIIYDDPDKEDGESKGSDKEQINSKWTKLFKKITAEDSPEQRKEKIKLQLFKESQKYY